LRRLLLLFTFLLTACNQRTPSATPVATSATGATATSNILAPTATLPPAVANTPTPVPDTPTPPAVATVIGYIAAGEGSPGVFAAVEAAAQANGWTVTRAADPTGDGLRALVADGTTVIVADGAEFEAVAREVASANVDIYVIGLNQAGGESDLPNLLTIGGAESREDQLSFMAGAVAGFLTEGQVVTAIANPTTVLGLKYRNGFLHGVRYTCTRCRVDFIDLADESATAFAAERAALNAQLSSDVVFAAAGEAGIAGLRAAAEAGAWVVGAGSDIYAGAFESGAAPGADRVVTSAVFDLGQAVQTVLEAYAAGEPPAGAQSLSAASGAVTLLPYLVDEEILSELDRQDIAAILAKLADGSLDTGVNPLTGDEL
jgi:basic membrane lipoprotein Med (substrate-binding protein (PBP1-ABC) superfamily)